MLSKQINKILYFFLPKICTICSKEGDEICSNCQLLTEEGGCEKFDEFKAFFCFKYNEHSGKIIKDLKYNSKLENAKIIAEIMHKKYFYEFQDFDFIIPVGTSFVKRLIRKYNSPNLISIHLSKMTKIPVLHNFFGKRFFGIRKSQVGLSKEERIENLKKAFYVNKGFNLKGKKILLIDDVITTGSTIRTCVKEIKKFKPKEVKVLSFLRRYLIN